MIKKHKSHNFYNFLPMLCEDNTYYDGVLDENGKLITKEKALDLIAHLQNYLSRYDESDVNEFNQFIDECELARLQELNSHSHKESNPRYSRKYVYIFYSDILNQYKIGISNDLERRVSEFAYINAKIVAHSSLLDNAIDYEQKLHEEYKDYSCGNEWFKFSDDLANSVIEKVKNL